MKITTITRLISDHNYGNFSATSTLEPEDDLLESAKKLDMEVRKMISATEIQYNQAIQAKREKEDTIDLLKRALAYAEDQEIPF